MQSKLDLDDGGSGKAPKVRVGCISWTYPDWNGTFYPAGTKSTEYLGIYSKMFDIVEVDSTFYRAPNDSMVKQWKDRTLPHFLFNVKLPKRISHDNKFVNVEKDLKQFEKTVFGLGDKLGCVFFQLPPNTKKVNKGGKPTDNFAKLESFLEITNPSIRYAVEFRDESWLVDETFALLSKHKACFVWGVNEHIEKLPTILTTDFAYLRFMGNFNEFTKFDKTQSDKTALLEQWWKNLSGQLDSLKQAYVLMSNHFAGYAPESASQFKKMAGLF